MKAILDTNFLLIPAKFKVDIFFELRKLGVIDYYTIDSVIKELESLSKSSGAVKGEAILALKLVKLKEVKILKSQEIKVDKELLRLSAVYTVCTQDRELIKKISSSGAKTISLRQGKYLKES
ncbi:MAG: DNA-binding protein [Candidatus Aenigmarchaeota archaeon]|nr:DNA-binding protein [Candidatus Aenigmarchaeota archaeon]